tara:strand:+ start:277 stop:507 length:231 start_codon:yes stop_codon:yes gene_type:complete
MKLNKIQKIGLIIGISFIGISSFIYYQYNQLLEKSMKDIRCGNNLPYKRTYPEYTRTIVENENRQKVVYFKLSSKP